MTKLRLLLLATTALTAMQFASPSSHAQTAPLVVAQAQDEARSGRKAKAERTAKGSARAARRRPRLLRRRIPHHRHRRDPRHQARRTSGCSTATAPGAATTASAAAAAAPAAASRPSGGSAATSLPPKPPAPPPPPRLFSRSPSAARQCRAGRRTAAEGHASSGCAASRGRSVPPPPQRPDRHGQQQSGPECRSSHAECGSGGAKPPLRRQAAAPEGRPRRRPGGCAVGRAVRRQPSPHRCRPATRAAAGPDADCARSSAAGTAPHG